MAVRRDAASVAKALNNIGPSRLDEAARRYLDREVDVPRAREPDGDGGFVKAEIVALSVLDGQHILMRLALAPRDVRREAPLAFTSLAINGSPVKSIQVQPPRPTVSSRGEAGLEFMVWGEVDEGLAHELRSRCAVALEGVLKDGRVLSGLRAAER
jgi:hypothetical protein